VDIFLPDTRTRYINMDSYVNRNQSMVNLLTAYGFSDYARVPGVYEDHRQAHIDAAAGTLPVLVLEDDCVPFEYRNTVSVPDDADVVYLGNVNWDMEVVHVDGDVYRILSMLGATAVLYLTDRGRSILSPGNEFPSTQVDRQMSSRLRGITAYCFDSPVWYQYDVPRVTAVRISSSLQPVYHGGGISDYPQALAFTGIPGQDNFDRCTLPRYIE